MSPTPREHRHAPGHAHSHDDEHDHRHDHPHGHDDAHDHASGHGHAPEPSSGHPHPRGDSPARPLHGTFTAREARQAKRLAMVLGLITVFFFFELTGALYARSVVLKADALHLLMDVLALAMSLLAMRIAVRRPTPRFTFGMRRAEPVAAIFNAMLVLAATTEIVREGLAELHGTGEPRAAIMLVVAAGALVVNGISAWLLHGVLHDHGHDHGDGHAHDHGAPRKAHGHTLNLRGAWLHLLGDALGSVAALVAAVVIQMGGSVSVDAFASFVVAAILVLAAYRVVRDATLVLLEAAPVHLPVGVVREVILAFPGIAEVHDLHVWTLGAGHDAITAHVRGAAPDPTLARRLSKKLRAAFETEYVTVQVESREEECVGEESE
jgi:cobalt-zinc-cadmium efflux system protein